MNLSFKKHFRTYLFFLGLTVSVKGSEYYSFQCSKMNLQPQNLSEPLQNHFKNLENRNSLFYSFSDFSFQIQNDNTVCSFEFNGDIDTLMEKIRHNSISFLEKNSNYSSAFSTEYLKTENRDFEVALNTVLTDLYQNAYNDIQEDFCQMNTLKIVFGNEKIVEEENLENVLTVLCLKEKRTLAYYVPYKNLIVLNIDVIKATQKNSILLWESIAYLLRHEINHMRQHACDCRKNYDSFLYYDEKYYSFLLETSAESETYNLWKMPMLIENKNDTNLHTYPYERKYEAMLLLLTLGREDLQLEDYYRAIFDGDQKLFCSFLGANSEEEIKELYYILNRMDATLFFNDLSFQSYKTTKPLSYHEAKKAIGFDYKLLIFRKVLEQLKEYTKTHPDFSMQSNLYLYGLIREILIEDSYYYDENSMDKIYDETFFYHMDKMELSYFSFLEKYYGQKVESVRNEIHNPIYSKLKEMEIYRSMAFTTSLINFYYVEPVEDLYQRFPILSSIVFSSSYHLDYDDEMEKSHNMKIREKIF